MSQEEKTLEDCQIDLQNAFMAYIRHPQTTLVDALHNLGHIAGAQATYLLTIQSDCNKVSDQLEGQSTEENT